MTKEQQKIVDKFHEQVISLIFKRRRAMLYGNGQDEYERITAEINKIEDERRKYERDIESSRQEKREITRGVSEVEERTTTGPTEAEI